MKILSLTELKREAERLCAAGKRIVATNGCFDILHVGHVRYLASAAELGDVLIVGVNGDESVRALKGEGRPINRATDRAEVLAALEVVDVVVVFPELRATNFLAAAQPAVYAKGGDYTAETLNLEEREVLKGLGTTIKIIPFKPGYSSSELLTRIQQAKP
jgi:rfaE bifunctional protein nucleotidyltransferase chain/domain